MEATNPPAAARHSKIERVAEDVYMVRGKMPSAPGRPLFERMFLYYSRTMTIVRQQTETGEHELILINSLRLNEKTLAELAKLGRVKHVIRLGSFHGVDDSFYLKRYEATYWNVQGMENARGLWLKPEILTQTHFPIRGSQLFEFDKLTYPEAIIVLEPTEKRAGIAITTDSIQNHRSIFDIDNSPLVSLAIWRIGLVGKARLGPIWLREQTPEPTPHSSQTNGEKKREMIAFFRPQFQRLLTDFEFDMLIPGHGWPIYQGAKAPLKISMDEQLPTS